MNSEARQKLELSEAQIKIQRLRVWLAIAPPTVHKDFSLVSRVPKWSGTESAISREEFFPNIKGSARIGHWLETDCLQVARLGLVDNVRTFYEGENVLWQNFGTTCRKTRSPHSAVMNTRESDILGKNAPNGKDRVSK